MPRAAPEFEEAQGLTVGTRVRVACRFPRYGHIRTPFYLRGKIGFVESHLGWFLDAEKRARSESGQPPLRVYRVKFAYNEIWGNRNALEDRTVVMADLSEDWLEPVEGTHDARP
jgi:hypothetical protein